MSGDYCVENLVKEIVHCDPSTIGNLVNECIASLDSAVIEKLIRQVKAICTDSDAVSTILYYLDLCKPYVGDSALIKSIAPVLPGMSCLFDPQQVRSLAVLVPGEFLAGFIDGIDERFTPFLLKKFVDPCIPSHFLQAMVRCVVLSLTDSLIATIVRLPVQLGTEYQVRGELEEELPYWHVYLWNSLAVHFIINGLLFSMIEVMKACAPQNWKHHFETQLLRIRIPSQVAKLMLTFAWGGCRAKGITGYIVNVLGQVLGQFSTFSLLSKLRCLSNNTTGVELREERLAQLEQKQAAQDERIREIRDRLNNSDQRQSFLNRLSDSFSSLFSRETRSREDNSNNVDGHEYERVSIINNSTLFQCISTNVPEETPIYQNEVHYANVQN